LSVVFSPIVPQKISTFFPATKKKDLPVFSVSKPGPAHKSIVPGTLQREEREFNFNSSPFSPYKLKIANLNRIGKFQMENEGWENVCCGNLKWKSLPFLHSLEGISLCAHLPLFVGNKRSRLGLDLTGGSMFVPGMFLPARPNAWPDGTFY